MKQRRFFFIAGAILFFAAGIFANTGFFDRHVAIATKPVYVPDTSRESEHLADTTLAWDATMKTTNVPADSENAHFVFNFTNVATQCDVTLTTNIKTFAYVVAPTNFVSPKNKTISPITKITTVTNVVAITNSIAPIPVTILTVHPSCGCTTAQLPPLPWTLPPGTNSQIGVTVNLAGKFGTIVKTVHIGTDKGSRDLIVQITILPPVIRKLTDAERAQQMAMAKVNRQAVFKNDCASCHVKNGEGKYGKMLYDADCGICHEAEHRATMVPDLHNLKAPTNEEFWRTWISHGKPGSLMPAFSTADGGPLTDMQIASLVAYLDSAIPSKVPSPQ